MGEHLVLYVNRLVVPEAGTAALPPNLAEKEDSDEPLIDGDAECRICQEDDIISNLEVPCACNGSLKFAHRKCVQRWCNEKGDVICEICHQTYRPGYTAPSPSSPRTEDAIINIGTGWTISSAALDLHNPHILLLEADDEEYAAGGARAAAFFRSAMLILMALLFLRHAWIASDNDDEDDMTFFSPFIASGLLLPCCIVAWAVCSLQQRRQRQIIFSTK